MLEKVENGSNKVAKKVESSPIDRKFYTFCG
jgi:hypothetical protein